MCVCQNVYMCIRIVYLFPDECILFLLCSSACSQKSAATWPMPRSMEPTSVGFRKWGIPKTMVFFYGFLTWMIWGTSVLGYLPICGAQKFQWSTRSTIICFLFGWPKIWLQ